MKSEEESLNNEEKWIRGLEKCETQLSRPTCLHNWKQHKERIKRKEGKKYLNEIMPEYFPKVMKNNLYM